jgi:phosphinothricin acetyltransferase
MSTNLTLIRPATEADIPAIQSLYAHHVLTGTGTFALTPPSIGEMLGNLISIRSKGLPYLVIMNDNELVGFAYIAPFKPREGYAYSAENSIYMAPNHQKKGLGKALLAELCQKAKEAGIYSLLAIIGDSENYASIKLHSALGFAPCGAWPKAGFKFEKWRDIVLMTRLLNSQDAVPIGTGWNR